MAVVEVHQCESVVAKAVEEALFSLEVCVEGFVIVEMVAGEIGEYAAFEVQTGNSALLCGMAAYFHCSEGAAGLHHIVQQTVYGQRVGSGLHGLVHGGIDYVAYG